MTIWIAEMLSLAGSARGGLGPEPSEADRMFHTLMVWMILAALVLAGVVFWAA